LQFCFCVFLFFPYSVFLPVASAIFEDDFFFFFPFKIEDYVGRLFFFGRKNFTLFAPGFSLFAFMILDPHSVPGLHIPFFFLSF